MKKNLLITGANGMLANQLAKQLEPHYNIRYLSRRVTQNNQFLWDIKNNYIDLNALKEVHTIVHLAGAPIADKRWTATRKQEILSSRVASARLILNTLTTNNLSINSFISASAIGYYGSKTTEQLLTEKSNKGDDFLSNVCEQWEEVAHSFTSNNIASRMSIVRIGIIFSNNGGALKKLITPISYGMGSGLGTGKQYMPWIHTKDLSNLFEFLITNNHLQGVYNAVSPESVTNIELTKKIGKVLNRKILLPNIPALVLQLIFGEMSSILLNGTRVSSEKIVKEGFKFTYGNIDDALDNLLKHP